MADQKNNEPTSALPAIAVIGMGFALVALMETLERRRRIAENIASVRPPAPPPPVAAVPPTDFQKGLVEFLERQSKHVEDTLRQSQQTLDRTLSQLPTMVHGLVETALKEHKLVDRTGPEN